MDEQVLNAALAGLLHDVGKFAQRADVGSSRTWGDEAEREYKYEHAVFSGDFVERYLPSAFKPLSPPAYHHAPKNDFDRLVQLADRLSANERDVDRKRHPKQLLSVFCRIDMEEAKAPPYRYHPLRPLELDREAIFPSDPVESDNVADLYKALWDGEGRGVAWPGFVKEAQRLKEAHEKNPALETYLESMLWLMQRYAWCIPSAYYNSIPDMSLFDHSRTTAAIAACLTAHSNDQIGQWLTGNHQKSPAVALLVGGDISGIQSFVYTITSRGAASALRGRSLYLQLLTEAMARYVLRRLGLPITNLIQASGGHFYLLARHSDSEALAGIRQDVSRILLAFHSGDLYLALECVPIVAGEFKGRALSGKWKELSEKWRTAKGRKFAELDGDLHPLVFGPGPDEGNEEKTCQVCGREHKGTKEQDDERRTRKCPQCVGFESLGEELRQARYLRLSEIDFDPLDPDVPSGAWQAALGCFGMAAGLGEDIPPLASGAVRSVLLALSDQAFDSLRPDSQTAIGRRFLVNVTPILTDEECRDLIKDRLVAEKDVARPGLIKPFEVMEAQSEGIKRLGVLRMDVDNMGWIISEGLGDNATFSRLATLSFTISLFFEGWVAILARKYSVEGGADKDRVYSIYSGGDDLFFVGSWDVMPELALEIRNDLRAFAAEHEGIHNSAGIALVGGKYPLYKAAADAGEALEASKARPSKNAVTFLGQTVAWQTFAETVKPTTDLLIRLVESKRAPRALLQRLQAYYLLYAEKEKEVKDRGEEENKAGVAQVYWGPWHWRAAYFLKRLADKHKEASDEFLRLRDRLSGDNFRAIEWIGLAARWAALKTRSN